MKDSLQAGLSFAFTFKVPENKTVPALFPESPEFQLMPRVLATGFLVGLIEWACIQAVNPHLDWPREQTVGIGIHVTHCAATPVGLSVRVTVHLDKVEGRKLRFSVCAHDGMDEISAGFHERFIVDEKRFSRKAVEKGMKCSDSSSGAA